MQTEMEAFLEHLTSEGRSPNTRAAYRADLRGFHRFLQTVEPGVDGWPLVSGQHLAAYVACLQEQGSSPATLRRKAIALGRFFDFLGKERPALESLPQFTPKPLSLPLSPGAIDALLTQIAASTANTARRDRALLALLWETGAQVSEVVGLNRTDFDETTGEILLGRGGSRQRRLTLSPAAAEAVQGYVSSGVSGSVAPSGQKPLFCNQRGGRLTRQSVWVILRSWAVAAGIREPLTPRLLRQAATPPLLSAAIDQQPVDDRRDAIHPLLLDGLPPVPETIHPPTNR